MDDTGCGPGAENVKMASPGRSGSPPSDPKPDENGTVEKAGPE